MRVSALPELQAYPPSFSPPPKAAMEAREFIRVSLHYGIRNSRNPEKKRNAVYMILAGIPILDFDISAGKHFGEILAHSKEIYGQDRDKMIAAHCRSLGYTLVTDNIKDFQYIDGLDVVTWRTPGDI
jgi:tRNA(fMet)-specific endonuclease VapC